VKAGVVSPVAEQGNEITGKQEENQVKKLGRNEPCHCGSGRKYKKCCLRKDEEDRQRALEEQEYERDVEAGRIDPFAGDEDWEEEPEDETEEYLEEEDDFFQDYSPRPAEESLEPDRVEQRELSPEDLAIVEQWGKEYVTLREPDALRDHIENFLTTHPQLVSELDLGGEPLLELGGMYIREGRHESYIEVLTRLRSEFPEEYLRSFPYFDNDMIAWAIINNQKEKAAQYLDNYRQDPDKDADCLFELIHFMMSWNCQDILAGFLPDICKRVCTSPRIIGGSEIITPLIFIHMAPYLDQGPARFDPEQLCADLKIIEDFINPVWLDPDFLKKRMQIILGSRECLNIDDCRTRKQAVERYDEMTAQFMGWLGVNTGLDWCAAGYHSGLVFEYLAKSLPAKKKHRTAFPFEERNMERLLIRLTQNMLWLDPSRLFGMLNGIYCFQGFLEDTRSLAPEEAKQNRKACTSLFEKGYPALKEQDFKAMAWRQFPRADMEKCKK
jgi:hypothetical protein